ncbi:MAG: hypothetical protein AAEJ57_05965, partial [Opitutales bacterium]
MVQNTLLRKPMLGKQDSVRRIGWLTAYLFFSAFHFLISDLQAAPVAYSGKIAVDGENFDGPGHFRFQLLDHNGSVLWHNAPDGAAVTTVVNRGHYS